MLKIPDVQELSEAPQPVPEWLHRNNHGGQVIRGLERNEIDQDINERLIVEFYSR